MWSSSPSATTLPSLEAALDTNYIRPADLDTLKEWRKDPANWVPATRNN